MIIETIIIGTTMLIAMFLVFNSFSLMINIQRNQMDCLYIQTSCMSASFLIEKNSSGFEAKENFKHRLQSYNIEFIGLYNSEMQKIEYVDKTNIRKQEVINNLQKNINDDFYIKLKYKNKYFKVLCNFTKGQTYIIKVIPTNNEQINIENVSP